MREVLLKHPRDGFASHYDTLHARTFPDLWNSEGVRLFEPLAMRSSLGLPSPIFSKVLLGANATLQMHARGRMMIKLEVALNQIPNQGISQRGPGDVTTLCNLLEPFVGIRVHAKRAGMFSLPFIRVHHGI